ncbi:MAG TPA: SDR family NAD(P)-dependent oxidoreductase [Acidimicrobiales bacterium]|nr:SDR family NAD(P)-dependent oxidoreductase [Acidimicrobiales bacterium]
MGRRKDFELKGALALVTGAGSGIGRAIALELARRGSRVLAVDRQLDAAEKTAAACSEGGPEAHGLAADVSDLDAVTGLAADVAEGWGTLDILVNNAGVGMSARFAEMSMDDWRWIRGVNLDGVMHCCHAFGPAMVERGRGHVVNLSSGLGYTMHATEAAYVTTKAAVLAFSQCLRADWGPSGVGVTAICPGVINTPIVDATRYLGSRSESEEGIRKLFSRGHPPELVARDVVVAIQKDKIMVPSGWEAKAGWWAHRLLPLGVVQAMARRDI